MRHFCLWLLIPFYLFSGEERLVVIDAGHGGTDLGTQGKAPYCEEKKMTLQTARLLKKYLTQLGHRSIMTRTIDSFVPLERRVEIANQAHAALFISIHFNSARSPNAKGIEVFFFDSKANQKRAKGSQKLAQFILTRLVRRTKAVSRGVKKGNYYVLRETDMPAVIVEGGFVSNPQELSFLKDPAYLEQIARGIADGIDSYFKKN
jgi:N-acetylmuramoyl-L-alanine amidase